MRVNKNARLQAQKGMALHKAGRHDEARRRMARAVGLGPNDPMVRCLAGYAEHFYNLDPASALPHADAAIRLDGRIAEAYALRSRIWEDNDQSALALEDMDRAVEIEDNNHEFHQKRAVILHRLGLLEKAIGAFSRAITLKPEECLLFYQRADVYMDMDEPKQAYADYQKGLELDKNKVYNPHYKMGLAMERLKRRKAALEHYKSAPPEHRRQARSRIENIEQGRDGSIRRKAVVNHIVANCINKNSPELWVSELHGVENMTWFIKDYTGEYNKESGARHIIVKIGTRAGKDYIYWFIIDGKGNSVA